jgi:hypothetical protein
MISIEPIARHFFGEPNENLSKKFELRFGNNGSVSVDLKKNIWFDHENEEGGGVFDLIKRELGFTENADCYEWLEQEGYKTNDHVHHKQIAHYDYTDESGNLLFQVVRFERPKDFRQRKPNGNGGWVWKVKGTRQVPYQLPELINGITSGQTIYIPEGEKDVDNLRRWKLVATCNAGGASKGISKFTNKHVPYFKNADVVIIADNDETGKVHASNIAAKLSGVAQRIRVLDLGRVWDECPAKGDISDWITRGLSVAQLEELVNGLPDYVEEEPVIEEDTEEAAIQIEPGDRKELADAVEQKLLETSCGLYQRGGAIVRIDFTPMKTSDEKEVYVQAITECGNDFLIEVISDICRFSKYDARKKGDKQSDAPEWIARALKQRGTRLKLPVLNGITNFPILRFNGKLVTIPGYHQQTGLYFDPRGVKYPAIPEEPTQDDARRALDRLKKLFSTFPFVDGPSRSVALSLLLTTIARRAIDVAPLHAFDSPTAGTGKSMISDIVGIIVTGERAGVVAQNEDPREFDKHFSAILMRGGPLVPIDNCDHPLKGALLNQAITQPIVDCRILGKSETVQIRANSTISANGNNLSIVGDLTRRTIMSRMDAGVERPELLKFDYSPLVDAKDNRPELVSAALTVLRAFHVASVPVKETLGSFEQWSFLVRGALLCSGKRTLRQQWKG